MKIIEAATAGFCFGVERAVGRSVELLKTGRVACLGELIHNADVVSALERDGLRTIQNAGEAEKGEIVLIRAHGVARHEIEKLESRGAVVVDMTCPFVKKIHEIVAKRSKEGFLCVVIGDRDHPEVKGIAGWCQKSFITASPEELEAFLVNREDDYSVCVVAQTTTNRKLFDISVETVKKLCTNAEIFDTICNAMSERQKEAECISRVSDMMIVIGGRHSANTKRLCEICRGACSRVIHIERACEIEQIPAGVDTIGITAGASTPSWIIKEVVSKMTEDQDMMGMENGESFAEMLEQSIKTLYTRERVIGVVTRVTPTEIQIDLGTKHAGYIPLSEYTDDPNVKIEDEIKVGDEIECIVTRVNDVEGTAQLSKKQLDIVKNWAVVEEACENEAIVEGVVVEDNKGGIVVSVLGVRVFVPMSQTGLPRDALASTMLRRTVRLRVTEINRQRRRVIGSIRAVISEERKASSEKVWAEIAPGVKFNGVVKSITSYGVFVDIGGVDGMVHVSELAWSRIRHPSDVVKIGDEIEVYVISADPEKRKISLGYRKAEDNPWQVFAGKYNKGDVVTVTIAKLMPFGAFAEIIPGIDGLIHISQIADRRISRPGEVLSEGETVDVLITDIDLEARKISLSIRALTDPSALPEEVEMPAATVVETEEDEVSAVVEEPAVTAEPEVSEQPEEAEASSEDEE